MASWTSDIIASMLQRNQGGGSKEAMDAMVSKDRKPVRSAFQTKYDATNFKKKVQAMKKQKAAENAQFSANKQARIAQQYADRRAAIDRRNAEWWHKNEARKLAIAKSYAARRKALAAKNSKSARSPRALATTEDAVMSDVAPGLLGYSEEQLQQIFDIFDEAGDGHITVRVALPLLLRSWPCPCCCARGRDLSW